MMTIEKDLRYLSAFKRQVESDSGTHGLDIGFLFASPLIYKEQCTGSKESYSVLDPIEFSKEVQDIKEAATNSNQEITFQSAVATVINFSQMLNK